MNAHFSYRLLITRMLALGVMVAVLSCKDPASPGILESQTYLFEYEYVNFAWGYAHYGFLIDTRGEMYSYTYTRTDSVWRPANSDTLTSQELAQKYDHQRLLIKKIDLGILAEQAGRIEAASAGKLSDWTRRGADMGSWISECYVYETNLNRYRRVILRIRGDNDRDNLSPDARQLADWLESLTK